MILNLAQLPRMHALTFLHHPPFGPRPENQEITVLRCRAAPGEPVSTAFGLSTQRPVSNVELLASDLTGPSAGVAGKVIDIYVVKEWPQAGVGVHQSAPQVVGELLLKDDRQPIRDRYRIGCRHWRQVLRPARYYSPPDVRLQGRAVTDLHSATPKQIWVSIRVPGDARPGTYHGWIEVSSPTGTFAGQRLALELEVLPLALLEPEQDLFLWFRGTLDPYAPQHYVSPAVFRAQLQDIFEHGFRSISLNEYRRERLQRAVDIASQVGFRRNLVLRPSAIPWIDTVNLRGMRPLFYVSDEIDRRGETSIATHIAQSRMVKQRHGATMVSLMGYRFARRLRDEGDIGHPPDVVSYYLPENLDYFRAHGAFSELRGVPTYYHWASHMEKPNVHRVLAGFYLWRSGASGIAPYCYQHLPRYPSSPFNDFDEWDDSERIGNDEPPFKDHMTTYPGRSGPIPTVQWKGLSAGLYDLRYLTTLAATLDRVSRSADPAAAHVVEGVRSRLGSLLNGINMSSINITSSCDQEPYAQRDPSEYERYRRSVADDIVLLQDYCRKETGTS